MRFTIREARAFLHRRRGLAAGAIGPGTRIPVEQVARLDTYGNRAGLTA
ncbi:hypothetical protein [Mycobacterium sp.]